ncbi:hypothetical protein ACFVFQ_13865 [Streptomyces sp. NPDC057743]|uniref:hypothetical protein n=1 Tax=Streptomyces sp. NPDC057743 TaxID=3346236 RepID=UPI0036BCABDC
MRGGLGLLFASVLCYLGASNAAVAVGLAGTHGTFTVGTCEARPGGAHRGPSRECEGVFRPDGVRGPGGERGGDRWGDEDAGGRETRASIGSWTLQPGQVIEVRQGTGDYLPPGDSAPWGYLAMIFGGLLVASVMLPYAVRGTEPDWAFRGRRGLAGEERRPWADRISKWLAISGAVGMAVDILLAVVGP